MCHRSRASSNPPPWPGPPSLVLPQACPSSRGGAPSLPAFQVLGEGAHPTDGHLCRRRFTSEASVGKVRGGGGEGSCFEQMDASTELLCLSISMEISRAYG